MFFEVNKKSLTLNWYLKLLGIKSENILFDIMESFSTTLNFVEFKLSIILSLLFSL